MKYIEELKPGDTFEYNNSMFILTIDFRKNGSRLAIDLNNGQPKWLDPDCITNPDPIYKLDSSNNILPIKQENSNESLYQNNTI
jgi:hypothetical protein